MRTTNLDNQLSEISDAVLEKLNKSINNPRQFDTIFGSNAFELKSLNNGRAIFVADSSSSMMLIKNFYTPIIKQALAEITETNYEIEITDRLSYRQKREAIEKADATFFKNSHLSSSYTFDNFVIGDSNKMAYQASIFAVNNPGTYNPIFIYSKSGLGKTHLLQSIGNEYKNHHPNSNVLYISADEFIDEFIKYVRGEKESEDLKDFFSTIDMLLVDDIQMLKDKEETQQMFFNVFNLLVQNNKQIVLTSDKAPDDLKGLQDRLVSRFSGGLTVDIHSPDQETLIEILKMKIKVNNLSLDMFDEDVLSYLALNYSTNVRVLNGAFTRLIFGITSQKPEGKITLAFTKQVFLDDETRKSKKGKVDIDQVINSVSEYYNLTPNQLKSKVRTSQIALARQIAMYLSRELLTLPYQEIGKAFGKDHSTVLTNVQKISNLYKSDALVKKNVDDLSKRIMNTSK